MASYYPSALGELLPVDDAEILKLAPPAEKEFLERVAEAATITDSMLASAGGDYHRVRLAQAKVWWLVATPPPRSSRRRRTAEGDPVSSMMAVRRTARVHDVGAPPVLVIEMMNPGARWASDLALLIRRRVACDSRLSFASRYEGVRVREKGAWEFKH